MATSTPNRLSLVAEPSHVLGMAAHERDPWQGHDPWSWNGPPDGADLREGGDDGDVPPGFEHGEAADASAAEAPSLVSGDTGEVESCQWSEEDWQKWRWRADNGATQ